MREKSGMSFSGIGIWCIPAEALASAPGAFRVKMLFVILLADRVHLPLAPLIVLPVVFGASVALFLALTKRWTSHRLLIELGEWANRNQFSFRAGRHAFVPHPLSNLKKIEPRVRWMLSNDTTTLISFEAPIER